MWKKLSIYGQKNPNKTNFYLKCNTYATNMALHLCTSHSANLEKVTNIILEIVRERCKEYLKTEYYTKVAEKIKIKLLIKKRL